MAVRDAEREAAEEQQLRSYRIRRWQEAEADAAQPTTEEDEEEGEDADTGEQLPLAASVRERPEGAVATSRDEPADAPADGERATIVPPLLRWKQRRGRFSDEMDELCLPPPARSEPRAPQATSLIQGGAGPLQAGEGQSSIFAPTPVDADINDPAAVWDALQRDMVDADATREDASEGAGDGADVARFEARVRARGRGFRPWWSLMLLGLLPALAAPCYSPRRAGAASDAPLAQEVIQHASFVPVWASGRTPDARPVLAASRSGHAWRPRAQGGARAVQAADEETFRPVGATAPPANTSAPRPRAVARAASHPYVRPAFNKSQLRKDQVEDARALAKRLAQDRTPGRIDAPLSELEEMAMAVAEARADGVNPRTASKDAFALREFEVFAQLRGFDPNLKSDWTRRFPERESLKLASWLLWRAQRALPRSRKMGATVAKPMSIYQNYLALRRVFRARNVDLPPPHVVRETLRGLIRRFIRRFGIDALRPRRVEPVTPDLVQKCVNLAAEGRIAIQSYRWCLDVWECFVVTAWMVINLAMGTRKGESTELDGDVDHNDWLNRAAVTYYIGKRTYVDPPPAVLKGMREGDNAKVGPRGSKCDQWGTCHGTEPIILPFHDTPLNAAKWLRDIELRWPAHGAQRETLPLFCDSAGRPFKDSKFAGLIMSVLTAVVGETRAKLLSPHSWRVWLASSLRMCGASDARIQAMGRWLNPDSIKIYARMTKEEYAHWVDKLMAVKRIDTARTTNLPIMDAADAIAAWGKQLHTEGTERLERWGDDAPAKPAAATVPAAPLKRGARLSVYWSDMQEWFAGTFTTSRVEDADGGGKQRSSCIVYDPTGPWSQCTRSQLTYWHCLDDEQWQAEDA